VLHATKPGKQSDFNLYAPGYAHYFNIDSPASDWCNEASFNLNFWDAVNYRRTTLSQPLRAKINSLTEMLNAQIMSVIGAVNDPRVDYVSITEHFKGHRFCEPGHNIFTDMYGSDYVWFWNASPRRLADRHATQNDVEFQFNATYLAGVLSREDQFDWTYLLAMEKGTNALGPWQGASPRIALPHFHPTQQGHTAIKDALKATIKFN
jgi:hypothetical protein